MAAFLSLVLPIYFIVYFGVAMVLKSLIVARRTGINPLVLPRDDSAYGLVGRYFKLLLAVIFLYVVAYAFFPNWHEHFLPIPQLAKPTISCIGLALLLFSLIWIVAAQAHMKNSWRIGIDVNTKAELVTNGLFSVSRNPIFFGMIITLLGLFLTTPNALTALFLTLGYVLIQVQIRLEEDFLTKEHGEKYLSYRQKVRRLI